MSAAGMTAPLYDSVGLVDFSTRGKIELTGEDRAKFLHNLCTNDIKGLTAGSGCEAMLLDAKGHVQFYALVHNTGESLVLEELAAPSADAGARLRKHLDKYLIREKVVIADRTSEWGEILVAGAGAAEIVGRVLEIAVPTASLASVACPLLGDGAFVVCSVQATGPNYSIFCVRAAVAELQAKLAEAGALVCDFEAWQAPRIEARLPLYGVDISDKNLAQEIDRIELTISFRKGCYLGQETVARLDALGHVNKTLVVLEFAQRAADAEAVQPGTELTIDGQSVGQVTSAATRDGKTIALGYVRRGKNARGTVVESAAGPATITSETHA